MDRTDHAPQRHSPALLEPSYASLVLATMANELERVTIPRTLVTEVAVRRAYTVAVAAVTGRRNLPDNVANEVGQKVANLLPDPAPDATHSTYAALLRHTAVTA